MPPKFTLALSTALLVIVCLALFVAAGKEITAKEWLLSGVPAWLQGLGTCAAAVVGWKALNIWREQDTARRRADVAEALLMAAHRLEQATMAARISFYSSEEPEILVEEIFTRNESFKQLRAAREEVRVLDLRASTLMEGTTVQTAVFKLDQFASRVLRARGALTAIRLMGPNPKDEGAIRQRHKALEVLVEHYGNVQHNAMANEGDEFEQRLRAQRTDLEQRLKPFILAE